MDPIELAIWSAKYSAYCKAFESQRSNPTHILVCYDSDILKKLTDSGVALPFEDEYQNGDWMNGLYKQACKKAVPIYENPKPCCVFLGVAEGYL